MEPFLRYFKLGRDWLVGVGDTSGIRAADNPNQITGNFYSFLLVHLKIPDDANRGMRGYQCDTVNLFLAKFPVLNLHDILPAHFTALYIGCNRY